MNSTVQAVGDALPPVDNGHITMKDVKNIYSSYKKDKQKKSSTELPKQPKHWQFKISCLYAAFAALGFSYSILGPTLVDLEEIYQVDTKTISFVFTGTGLGCLVGALLCGFIYEYFNYEAQFFIATFTMGLTCAVAPWTGNMVAFMVVSSVQAIVGGFIDAAGQAYVLHVMAGHRFQEPVMQAAHASWSLGATIEPFIVQPFLTEKSKKDILPENVTLENATVDVPTAGTDIQNGSVNIRFGYLLSGSLIALFSFLYFIAWCMGSKNLRQKQNKTVEHSTDKNGNKMKKNKIVYDIICLAILFSFFFTQLWIELGLGHFVASFAVKALDWSKRDASWVTSALWGSQCAGRVIAIPVSAFMSPRAMVNISVVGTALSAGIMVAMVTVNDIFYWISVILAGVTMSSTFGSMVLWSSHHIQVTGTTSSVFLVGSSLGSLVGPVVTGLLFDELSPMYMIYLFLAASFLQLLAVVVFNLFIYYYPRKYKKKYYMPEINISFIDPSKL